MHFILLAALALQIGPVSAMAPNRQPQMAAADGKLFLVFGSGHSIWISHSKDEGRSFSTPNKLAQIPVLALGRHRGPRVVVSGKTIVVSAVGGSTVAAGAHSHGLPSDGNLLAWRSTDGGRSWSEPATVNDVPGAAREGLHAMAVDSQGTIAAVWLDLRSQGTKLFGALSHDDGKTWSRNVLLYESPDGSICQCCDPSIVSTGVQHFAVMFRNALKGDRDLYLLNWRKNAVATPEKLGRDSWKLNACPMDGGGIVNVGGRVLSAWRRDETVFAAQPGKAETAIGKGKDVALALGEKGVFIAWTDPTGIQVHTPESTNPIRLSKGGGFPAMTRLSNGDVIVAWEQDGSIFAKTLR